MSFQSRLEFELMAVGLSCPAFSSHLAFRYDADPSLTTPLGSVPSERKRAFEFVRDHVKNELLQTLLLGSISWDTPAYGIWVDSLSTEGVYPAEAVRILCEDLARMREAFLVRAATLLLRRYSSH